MVSYVICEDCGTLVEAPAGSCWRCGAPTFVQLPGARKSRWVAALLAALVPGLGHIYLGEYGKGALYMVGAGGLGFLGFDLDLTMIGAAVGVPVEMGGLGLWAHGVWSAYQTARRMELEQIA